MRRYLAPPDYADPDDGARAHNLHAVLLSLMAAGAPFALTLALTSVLEAPRAALALVLGEVAASGLLALLHRGRLQVASWLLLVLGGAALTASATFGGGLDSAAYELGCPLLILLAGAVVGWRAAVGVAAVGLLAGLGLWAATDPVVEHAAQPEAQVWLLSAMVFPLAALLQFMTAARIQRATADELESRTRREAALRELAEAQAQLVSVARSLPGVVFRMTCADDRRPEFTYLSGHAVDLLGLSGSLRHGFEDFCRGLEPEDRASWLEAIDFARDEQQRLYFVGRYQPASGGAMWLRAEATPDRHGDETIFDGILLDVTETVQAESERSEAWALLRAAIEELPSGIVIAEAPDGALSVVNPAAMAFAGQSERPLVGVGIDEYANWRLHRTDGRPYEPDQLPLARAIRNGEHTTDETILFRQADGSDRWVSVSASPVRDRTGTVRAAVAVLNDITTQKTADRDNRARLARRQRQQTTMAALAVDEQILAGDIVGAAEVVVAAALVTVDADRASLWLTEADGPRLRCTASAGEAGRPVGALWDTARCPRFMETVSGGWSIDAWDAWSDPRTMELSALWPDVADTASMACLPVREEGRLAGILWVESAARREWTSDEIAFFQSAADQMRLALANARLRRALDELHEREAALESFIRNSADGISLTDEAGKVVTWNPAAERITGLGRQAVIGRPIWEVQQLLRQAGGEAERVGTALQRALRTGRLEPAPAAGATFLTGADGVPRAVEETAFAFETRRGYRLGGIARDITARQQAEDALREAETMLRTVLDTIPVRVFWKGLDLRYLGCNKAFAADSGYGSPDQLVGETDGALVPADLAAQFQEDDRRVIESGQPRLRFVERSVDTDGTERWLRTSKVPLRNGSGEVVGVLGSYEDITEQIAAESDRARLLSIVESSSDLIGTSTPEGEVTYLNAAGRRWVGLSADEPLAGRRIADLHPGWATERILRDGIPTAVERGSWQGETAVLSAGGREIPVSQLVVAHRAEDGSLAYLSTIMRDITDRQRAQEALERRLVALSQPLDDGAEIAFGELFDIEEIQRIQDMFAKATGVASIITNPDGTPLTRPSNFCRLCEGIIRQTDRGRRNCYCSDAIIGRHHPEGPIIQPCLSGGLWDAGSSITVGGHHVANWLIGQVRNDTQSEDSMRRYAEEIGADVEEFMAAFRQVPTMPAEQFEQVAAALFAFANQLSTMAYQNVQQARFIAQAREAEEALRISESRLRALYDNMAEGVALHEVEFGDHGAVVNYRLVDINPQYERILGVSRELVVGRLATEVYGTAEAPFLETFTGVISTGQTDHVELYFEPMDRWFSISVAPWGRRGFATIFTDTTERRRAAEALRENATLLRTVMTSLPVVIYAFDTDGTFRLSEGRGLALLGLEPGEVVGRNLYELYADYPETTAAARIGTEGGEVHLVTEVGGITWDSSYVPLRDEAGEIRGAIGVAMDVTERERAAARLAESERLYRLLAEHATDVIALLEADGRICFISQAAERLLGGSAADLIGVSAFASVHRSDVPAATEALRRVTAGEGDQSVECRIRRADGEYQWVEVSGRLAHDDALDRPRVIIVVRDISASKQAETALRGLLDAFDDMAMLADADGRVIAGNQALYQGLERTEDTLVGTVVYDALAAELREQVHEHHQEAIRTGRPVSRIRRFRDRLIDSRVYPVVGGSGKVDRLAVLSVDITERAAAEQAVRESEEALRQIFEQSPFSVFLCEDDGRFVQVNRACEESMGLSREVLIGRTATEVGASAGGPQEALIARLVAEQGYFEGIELASLKPTGEQRIGLCSGRKVTLGGRDLMLCVWSDVTDLKSTQAELEEAIARLEASNAEMERFTYAVSHDLKSPLITITGFLERLGIDLAAGRSDRLDRSMDRIRTAADRMMQLLDELLELSRIGRLANPSETVFLSAVAHEAADLVAGQLAQRGIELAVADDLPAVFGDRPRIREVFQNLLDNAAKFMGDQQEPRIEVAVDTIDSETGWPVVVVRDNGIGFEPTYRDRIFGLFDQLDPARGGTGIGLALVKRVVETHGGRIWADSAGPGEGATFSLLLPPVATEGG